MKKPPSGKMAAFVLHAGDGNASRATVVYVRNVPVVNMEPNFMDISSLSEAITPESLRDRADHWVSTSERLPAVDRQKKDYDWWYQSRLVVIHDIDGRNSFARHGEARRDGKVVHRAWNFWLDDTDIPLDDITHWMDVPIAGSEPVTEEILGGLPSPLRGDCRGV